MLRRLKRQKGQNTLEYALLIAVVVGALIAMQRYINRGIQGGLRGRADDIGEQFDAARTEGSYEIRTSSKSNETYGIIGTGVTQSKLTADDTYNKTIKSETTPMNATQ